MNSIFWQFDRWEIMIAIYFHLFFSHWTALMITDKWCFHVNFSGLHFVTKAFLANLYVLWLAVFLQKVSIGMFRFPSMSQTGYWNNFIIWLSLQVMLKMTEEKFLWPPADDLWKCSRWAFCLNATLSILYDIMRTLCTCSVRQTVQTFCNNIPMGLLAVHVYFCKTTGVAIKCVNNEILQIKCVAITKR